VDDKKPMTEEEKAVAEFDRLSADMAARRVAKLAAQKAARLPLLQKYDEIKTEHGDDNVAGLWVGDALVVVRRPTQSNFTYFQDQSGAGGDEGEKAQRLRRALETLARQCLVYPDEVAYRDLCKVHVGLPVDAGGLARKLGDDAVEVSLGKS
jgi:hypothetical protein